MKWLNGEKIGWALVGFLAAIVVSSRNVKADFTFGEPVNLGPTVNGSSGDAPDCISYDGLEMYFDSNRSGGYGGWDLWVSKRETIEDDWGAPVNLGPKVNTNRSDACAIISADGLELYFNSFDRSGGYGDWDAWVTRRSTKDEAWGVPVNLGPPVNSSAGDGFGGISPDGLELYFDSERPGGYGSSDIWVSRRATKNDPWGEPINLGMVVNSTACEGLVFLSPDGLLLFFSEDSGEPVRRGGFGRIDMWVTRRTNLLDPWGTPMNLGPIVNTSSLDGGPRISPDGSTLYFASERPGGYGGAWGDIYKSQIIPIIDLNGDGSVDASDMCIVVDHWGTDNSLCDIGPMPWGDGVIDVEDMKVLAEHLFTYPGTVAHWALDEAEGIIAYDSAGVNDAVIFGGATWQPDNGQIDGALEFNGVDGCAVTNTVLNPSDGPFSVFAWIKGGAAGQVVVSQQNGANWLSVDVEGNLMTELTGPGRSAGPLFSQTIITDGQWHRIGFVWDGLNRMLYVDDIVVAEDTQIGLTGSNNGLYIGCDQGIESSSFFSGLIDDVRIYNRAVSP
ncbi:MAG: LamG-like jellyroll fold domain-containing protein [Planctomycetota bacterium]|jgi:hypothetical protein